MSAVEHPLRIRPALVGDAPQLADVHVTAWRQAYAHILSPAFLAALDVAERTRTWRRWLSTPSEQVQVVADVVADGEDVGSVPRVVGFAVAGPSPDEPPVRDWALRGLYVLVDHDGDGTGQRLLDTAVGERPCSLWVAEDHPRARAFYARSGFHLTAPAASSPRGRA